jgi:hypothetical protein
VNNGRPQYVNLFQKDTGWKTRILKTRGSVVAISWLVCGLLLLSWYDGWRLQRAEAEAGSVAAEYESRIATLATAGATYRTRDDYRKLQQRVKDLTELIARQDVVLGRMQATTLGTRGEFSARLAAVARAQIDGVWLTQLEIDTVPGKIRLAGVAMAPELLPRYLLQLRGAPELGIHRLSNLTVDRTVNDERAALAGAVGFSLIEFEPEREGAL